MPHATLLVFDNCNATSVTAFADVLGVANQLWKRRQPDAAPLFTWRLVSPDGRAVTTSVGLKLDVDGGLPRGEADVVYIPACHFTDEARLLREIDAVADRTRAWLVRHHRGGGWLAAGCSGAFVLGRCGLLDGKVATTSWWLAALFRREFPRAHLRADDLVTTGERLLCAGPVNAHFNLALRLVEEFGGRDLALACAKVLLIDANRPSQRPYVMLQDQLRHTDELVVRAQEWMQRHLVGDDFSIATVARAVGASPRNLIRKFKRAHGTTPIGYAQVLRIDLAKNLLETTALDLGAILERIGYQDAASFRRLFKQKTSLTPRDYRRRFAIGRPARRLTASDGRARTRTNVRTPVRRAAG
jgi:transcriptional regulator GlxA family with amidase domain